MAKKTETGALKKKQGTYPGIVFLKGPYVSFHMYTAKKK